MTAHPPDDAVAITGIGVVLPGADTVTAFWDNLRHGRSQLSRLTAVDPEIAGLDVHVAAQLGPVDVRRALDGLPERHAAKYSRDILVTMAAVASAWRDSGFAESGIDRRKLSIIQSSSRGCIGWWLSGGPQQAGTGTGARAMLCGLPASPAALSAIHLGAQGLVTTITSACVGGHHAIGLALRELRTGSSDAVLVGGYDFPLEASILATFEAMGSGVLSRERQRPERAIRPYTRGRDGMVLGEGAITLCLERASSAEARGARRYALIRQHGALNEAGHATRMDLTGKPTAELVAETVHAAGRSLDDVGYVCGHGTATRANDLAESRALRALYPGRKPEDLPPIGSNKPIYGHTLGAAGVVNVAATALMLHHQRLAPTINVDDVDPECAHDHVADGSRSAEFDLAVSLAFAVGSQTSAVVLEAAA